VNDATKRLDVEAISKGVNEIFDDAVVRYTFDELDPITINYANKEHFVHGGKGTFQNYNEDQKTAIKALPETADPNDYYLFFTDCYNRLDTAGNVSNEPVSGYMPVGRHYGFIYNEYTNARTIAHELAHGTNALHHTFSPESETFYTTSKTDNLMDYNGGEYLNHSQWQWSHEKHRNVLGFLDDEGEGEAKMSLVTKEGKVLSIDLPNYEKEYCFLTPSLCPIWLKNAEEIRFFDDGTVSSFAVNGTHYSAIVNSDNTIFYYYYEYDDFLKLSNGGQTTSKLVTEQDLNKSKIYTGYTIAPRGTPLFSFVDNSILGVNCKEIVSCQATDTIKQLRGAIKHHHVLPHNRRTIKYLGECETLRIAEQYFPEDGLARDFFMMFYDGCEGREEEILNLVDWCEKTIDEYDKGNCISQRHHITEKFAKKLRNDGVTTYEAFDEHYYIGTVLGVIVISEHNLWDNLSDDYNKNTGYNYSLGDLKLRYKILKNGGQFATSILNLEQEGKAAPLTTKTFIDKYGDASSLVAFVLFFELESDLINVEAATQATNKATRLFKKTPTKQLSKTTIAKNVKSYSQRLIGTLKKTFDELIEKGFKPREEGNVITFFTQEGDELVQIVNDKFVVKKWGVHHLGTVEKELDNGYWLVKNSDGSYSIDLGFKEGRKLIGKEVNEYYIKTGRSAPYADDCVVTEEVLQPNKEFYIVNNKNAKRPGGWASDKPITTINELRQDLAVLEQWKRVEDIPTCVKYRVKQPLRVRNGVVGPQVDFPTAEKGQGVIYFGGSQQYEIILPKGWADKTDPQWINYLEEIERITLK
jgi:hypothetical protein